MSLQSCNSAAYLNNNSNFTKESIDYDFYDSCFNEDNYTSNEDSDDFNDNGGVKNVQIKPLKKYSSIDNEDNLDNVKENNVIDSDDPINIEHQMKKDYSYDVTKCIAFENSESCSSPDIECTVSKNSGNEEEKEQEPEDSTTVETVSPILESFSSLSASSPSPSSELTNVTPFSSSSSSSSVKLNNDGDNYSMTFEEEDEDSSKLDMKLLSDVVDSLSLQKKAVRSLPQNIINNRIQCSRQRRKNMTFTNEQLRKIERENEILLKKIMSYTKPKPKQSLLINNNTPPPRIKASAAVNRMRKQQQINHDNFVSI